jgi:hypothetical protein
MASLHWLLRTPGSLLFFCTPAKTSYRRIRHQDVVRETARRRRCRSARLKKRDGRSNVRQRSGNLKRLTPSHGSQSIVEPFVFGLAFQSCLVGFACRLRLKCEFRFDTFYELLDFIVLAVRASLLVSLLVCHAQVCHMGHAE